MVAAALCEVFIASDLKAAKQRLAQVCELFSGPLPKVAGLLEDAEEDLLAFYCFPGAYWPKRSTNPLERLTPIMQDRG